MPDQLESSVVFTCASAFEPSVRGRAVVAGEGTFAGRRTASVSCTPLFFEQKNYAMIAEANEGHTLEFDHENVNLRKNITRFGRKDHVLSGTLNFRNDIGMSDLIFKLDGQEYLRITCCSRITSSFPGNKVRWADNATLRWIEKHSELHLRSNAEFRRVMGYIEKVKG